MSPCNYPEIHLKPNWREELNKARSMTEAQQRAYDQAQVMLAFSQGKRVECHIKDAHDSWCSVSPTYNLWEFDKLVFRIAPEPQEVWLWVKEGELVAPQYHHPDTDWGKHGYTKKLFREVLP